MYISYIYVSQVFRTLPSSADSNVTVSRMVADLTEKKIRKMPEKPISTRNSLKM